MIDINDLQELADIVGEDFFSAELYMRDIYSSDISSLPGIVNDLIQTRADAIAQPMSTEIVSKILMYCSNKGIPIVPRGHGTSGYGGALPTKNGLILEMTRLNDVFSIDRESMTIEVGAGIIWGNLLELLAKEGLTVAAYPSSAPSSTVGGWVAAGGTGIGSTKYGGIRDQIVDLEVVLPNGNVIRTSHDGEILSVYKKTASYTNFPGSDAYYWGPCDDYEFGENVTDLFLDSNGALGVITKVVLRIIPLQTIKPLVASFRSGQLMIHALIDILAATRPFYLHFITNDFYQMQFELGQAPETSGEWVVLSAYEGKDDELLDEIEKFHHFVRRHNGIVESDEIALHEWDERFYPMRIKRLGPSIAPSEVYVPLSNLDTFLEDVDDHFSNERYAIEGAVTNMGDVAMLAWFPDDERKKISFLMGWYRSLDFIDIGLDNDGRAYSIGMWNAPHARSYYGKKTLSKLHDVKRGADPKNILNPHKVFAGTLNLSLRFNLLIMFAIGIAFPSILFLVAALFPFLSNAYLSWLLPQDAFGLVLLFWLGMILGELLVEIANKTPISFLLTMGRPFMRLFRKLWRR
jgi:FAD/FMN-containing dehydrogenase